MLFYIVLLHCSHPIIIVLAASPYSTPKYSAPSILPRWLCIIWVTSCKLVLCLLSIILFMLFCIVLLHCSHSNIIFLAASPVLHTKILYLLLTEYFYWVTRCEFVLCLLSIILFMLFCIVLLHGIVHSQPSLLFDLPVSTTWSIFTPHDFTPIYSAASI